MRPSVVHSLAEQRIPGSGGSLDIPPRQEGRGPATEELAREWLVNEGRIDPGIGPSMCWVMRPHLTRLGAEYPHTGELTPMEARAIASRLSSTYLQLLDAHTTPRSLSQPCGAYDVRCCALPAQQLLAPTTPIHAYTGADLLADGHQVGRRRSDVHRGDAHAGAGGASSHQGACITQSSTTQTIKLPDAHQSSRVRCRWSPSQPKP